MSERTALLALLILSAPWAIVLLVALVRGYEVTVHLTRKRRNGGQ